MRVSMAKKSWTLRHLLAALLLICPGNADANENRATRIREIMEDAAGNGTFNGNVLVAKEGRIIFQNSYGYADAARSRKLNAEALFNIGSITKEFSSSALLQLQQRKKLSLTAPVRAYLPDLPTWANAVKISNTLNYTSGMPDVSWKSIRTDDDIISGIRSIARLNFSPGTSYDYNNNNIFLRQMIVERITRMGYKHYIERNLFKPCGMNNSFITPVAPSSKVAQGFKVGYVADKPELPITGGAYLTAKDMFKWSQCLNAGRLIQASSILSLGDSFNDDSQSSLGEATYSNGKMVRHVHDGRSGSFEALLIFDMRNRTTIVLLANSYRGKLFEIAEAIESAISGG
jgi:CubicO group peptidase (beta-lactamase class C family)